MQNKNKIDKALLPMVNFVKSLTDGAQDFKDGLHIDSLKLNLPLDLQIISNSEGLTLGSGPPSTYAPIGLTPVYHRIRMTITQTNIQGE